MKDEQEPAKAGRKDRMREPLLHKTLTSRIPKPEDTYDYSQRPPGNQFDWDRFDGDH